MAARLAAAAVAALFTAAPLLAGVTPSNSVLMVLQRQADAFDPASAFRGEFHVDLPTVPGITGVTMTHAGGPPLVLSLGDDGPTSWVHNDTYATLGQATAAMQGPWTIHVTGQQPSTTTFALDANSWQESNFFATPAGISPPNGAAGVSPAVVISWQPPVSGPYPAYLVNVYVDGPSYYPSDFLAPSAVSWDPPDLVPAGSVHFGVGYYVAASPSAVGALSVTSGSIAWGASPYAPPGYPDMHPFVALGAQTTIGFTVGSCAPADLNCDGKVNGADIGLLLGNWGGSGTGDINGDGVVNGADLGALLGSWAP